MFRSLSNWKSWDTLDKATFYSQLATVLTLFLTAIFSLLALRESRLARVEQLEYFLGEKAPDVQLVSVSTDATTISFYVKNSGESVAKSLSFSAQVLRGLAQASPFTGRVLALPPSVLPSADEIEEFPRGLVKGGVRRLVGPRLDEVVKVLGFTPHHFRLVNISAGETFDDTSPTINLTIHFQDIAGNPYGNGFEILPLKD